MRTVIFVIAISLGLFACSASQKSKNFSGPIPETKWILKKIQIGADWKTVNTKAFIRIEEAKNHAGGNGSCNNFSGNFSRDGGKVSFSQILSTKMFCQESQWAEDAYFQNLEKVNRIQISGKTMKLLQDEKVLLEFETE
ncbi:MAG: META domain-containing protein [Chitinophagaceae bacterium]